MKDLFKKRFEYYKGLAENTFGQLTDDQLFWQYNEESNSVATIVKHIAGNMISRWTNFLTEDGEKSDRNRDSEFLNDIRTRQEMMDFWEKGWKCFYDALEQVDSENINYPIYIRGEKHSVLDAILRQLAHYPYHIGQMVYIGKMLKNNDWKSLSIPKNKSKEHNAEMFSKSPETTRNDNSSPVCYAKSPEVRDDYKTD